MKQFLLILNGPSCGGKTEVANILLERLNNVFFASRDKIKWLISGYDAEKHGLIAHDIILATIPVALKNKLSVIKESALHEPEQLKKIAETSNTEFIVANISAPKATLDERFEQRIEAKKNGARISNVNHERFDELYEMYQKSKMKTPLEFDSSKQSPEEIAKAIIAYLEKDSVDDITERV